MLGRDVARLQTKQSGMNHGFPVRNRIRSAILGPKKESRSPLPALRKHPSWARLLSSAEVDGPWRRESHYGTHVVTGYMTVRVRQHPRSEGHPRSHRHRAGELDSPARAVRPILGTPQPRERYVCHDHPMALESTQSFGSAVPTDRGRSVAGRFLAAADQVGPGLRRDAAIRYVLPTPSPESLNRLSYFDRFKRLLIFGFSVRFRGGSPK
jgi:hypothetical protein